MKLILVILSFVSISAFASSMVSFNPIGSSPKGQFVALEEFGYYDVSKTQPFTKITIHNTWKNKIIGRPLLLTGYKQKLALPQLRNKARLMVRKNLIKYDIN